jgi:hypothetical protein
MYREFRKAIPVMDEVAYRNLKECAKNRKSVDDPLSQA